MKLSKRPWLLIALAVCLFTLTGGFMTVGVTNDQQPSIGYYTDGGTASLPPLSFEQIHEVVSHATDLLAESGGFLDGIFAEEQLEGFKTTTTCLEITFPDTQTTELSKMGKQIQYDRLLFVFKNRERITFIFWGKGHYLTDGFVLGTGSDAAPLTNALDDLVK